MSTSWSALILQKIEDGETSQDIIDYFNHPYVNENYIKAVQDQRRKALVKRGVRKPNPRTSIPAPGTRLRIVYDYAMSVGGIQKFAELAKNPGISRGRQLYYAKIIGVPRRIVSNFLRDFVRGRTEIPPWLGNYPNLTMKLRMEAMMNKTYKKKVKRLSIKDARNLW